MAYAPTVIYTLSLHDALPICRGITGSEKRPSRRAAETETAHIRAFVQAGMNQDIFTLEEVSCNASVAEGAERSQLPGLGRLRSEEHTSELQSHSDLVCRLLLE